MGIVLGHELTCEFTQTGTPIAPEWETVDRPKAAERAVLDMVRQARRIEFWRVSISEWVYPWGVAFDYLRPVGDCGWPISLPTGDHRRTVKS